MPPVWWMAAACGAATSVAPPEPARAPGVAPPSADVVGVRVEGEPEAYTFAVTVRSDETGCDRYADWWEVVSLEGALLYRRILEHSHPGEQPFERTGGPVRARPTDVVVVRAHLAPGGYGAAMRGSVAGGFASASVEIGFASALEGAPPQPTGCQF